MVQRVLSLPLTLARLPGLVDAVTQATARVPAIERTLVDATQRLVDRLDEALALLGGAAEDIASLRRDTVEPQQKRVEHIEDMVGRLESQIDRLQRTLDRLTADIEDATEVVRDGSRGPIAKVRDALTGDTE
ncbi:MAG: DUF1664 domain-containing protein [Actinomycetota bacterium]|nr:DUF1664 domain-containing protein [Actinomycetota bacterium]